ncbi:MAG: hypothetical protein NVS9B14_03630 [Candidatus Acidiferrum sp.]
MASQTTRTRTAKRLIARRVIMEMERSLRDGYEEDKWKMEIGKSKLEEGEAVTALVLVGG